MGYVVIEVVMFTGGTAALQASAMRDAFDLLYDLPDARTEHECGLLVVSDALAFVELTERAAIDLAVVDINAVAEPLSVLVASVGNTPP